MTKMVHYLQVTLDNTMAHSWFQVLSNLGDSSTLNLRISVRTPRPTVQNPSLNWLSSPSILQSQLTWSGICVHLPMILGIP